MSISATSGMISNIDYQSLITQLVNVKRLPINQLEYDKKAFEKANSAYGTLSTKVGELKSAADALRTSAGFNAFTASTSDSTIAASTATSSAATGSFSMVVTTIAKAHRMASSGVAASTSTVAAGAGVFEFKVGAAGPLQSVSVDATTTLTGLKDAINALKAGVTASVVNEGSGVTPYKLMISSDTTGTASAVTITQNGTSLTFPTTVQAAQDASFTVDGLTYTRTSNTVTDVITGVTLDLKSADPLKTVTISVARDTAELTKKITAFAEKYNAIVSYIKANNRYDPETKTSGVFFGDSVARSVWEDLRRNMTSSVSGLPDTMNRLVHAGMKFNSEGVLSVDSTALSSALSSSFTDVVNLFTKGTATTGFGELLYNTTSQIDDFVDGRIRNRQKGLGQNITNIKNSIRNRETALDAYENQLRAQFTALEGLLAGLKNQGNALMSF